MTSFLTYRAMSMRTALPRATQMSAPRSFSISARQFALNEDSTNDPNRAKNIDDHKHDSVSKSKDGKGEWKKELASNSEAAIKADRDEIKNAGEDIKKLQKEAEELGKKKQ